MWRILAHVSCDNVKGEMSFLVNASPSKTLQVHRSHDVEGAGQHFV